MYLKRRNRLSWGGFLRGMEETDSKIKNRFYPVGLIVILSFVFLLQLLFPILTTLLAQIGFLVSFCFVIGVLITFILNIPIVFKLKHFRNKVILSFIIFLVLCFLGCSEEVNEKDNSTESTKELPIDSENKSQLQNSSDLNQTNQSSLNESRDKSLEIPLEKPPFLEEDEK